MLKNDKLEWMKQNIIHHWILLSNNVGWLIDICQDVCQILLLTFKTSFLVLFILYIRILLLTLPHPSVLAVAPPMNLQVRRVTERTIDIEWKGSSVVTDYLITYVPTSLGGLQLELRVQGNVTNTTINKLEPGLEYNINVYTVIDNVISVPVSTVASTCKFIGFVWLEFSFINQITL